MYFLVERTGINFVPIKKKAKTETMVVVVRPSWIKNYYVIKCSSFVQMIVLFNVESFSIYAIRTCTCFNANDWIENGYKLYFIQKVLRKSMCGSRRKMEHMTKKRIRKEEYYSSDI